MNLDINKNLNINILMHSHKILYISILTLVHYKNTFNQDKRINDIIIIFRLNKTKSF